MADRVPCPRCDWPTRYFIRVTRSDQQQRNVCLPCVLEVAEELKPRRDAHLGADRPLLQGDEGTD